MKFPKWIIPVAIIAVLALWGISKYNGLVAMDQNVKSSWSQVENQYQRRSDLIPNLVNVVKGYASHERETGETVRSRDGLGVRVRIMRQVPRFRWR
mgnify:CR=1 FL=1